MAKIIITDDEPMNRRMTEFMLTKNGYETEKLLLERSASANFQMELTLCFLT